MCLCIGAPDSVPGFEAPVKYPENSENAEDTEDELDRDDTEEEIETSEVESQQFRGDTIAGTPSSSNQNISCEIEMQDVYQDENTS